MPQLDVVKVGCMRQQRILFSGLSLQLNSGEALVIEGENGCGKSSLLRIIAGIAAPLYGQVRWQQQLISQAAHIYWEQLHYLSHQNGLKLGLTVKENLLLRQHLGLVTQIDLTTVLNSLQLSAYQHTLVKHLSAGQKRKLALAKLFLFPKPLWILDEPLTALDLSTQQFFMTQLDLHLDHGGMAIISTHQPLVSVRPIKSLRLPVC